MKVDFVDTNCFLGSGLSSPVKLPWQYRRSFLLRRRGRKSANNSLAHQFLGFQDYAKVVAGDSGWHAFFDGQLGRGERSPSGKKLDARDIPDPKVESRYHGQQDPTDLLGKIGENASLYHQRRKVRRMAVLDRTSLPKKRRLSIATSPCARSPNPSKVLSKDRIMQLTGLASISPVSRPLKKQRFLK